MKARPFAGLRRALGEPGPVARASVGLARELAIAARSRAARRRFRVLRGRRDLKVHLGCGDDVRPGWVNIDVGAGAATEGAVVVRHDLRRGLPLEGESCVLIYSSHLFEHLGYRAGARLMRDCHRSLRPGGVLRFALPDFKGMFEAYLNRDAGYLELVDIRETLPYVEPGTETLVDHVNYGVYQFGEHKTIYDQEKLTLLLRHIGFRSVSESSFRSDIDPDTPLRRRYSFYVDATK